MSRRKPESKPLVPLPEMTPSQMGLQAAWAGLWLLLAVLYEAFVPVIVPIPYAFQLVPISVGLGIASALVKLRFGIAGRFVAIALAIAVIVMTAQAKTSIVPLCLFLVADILTHVGAALVRRSGS